MNADKQSVLPPPLRAGLDAVRGRLPRGAARPKAIAAIADMIAALPLHHLSMTMAEIRMRAGLFSHSAEIRPLRAPFSWLHFSLVAKDQFDLLRDSPELEYLFVFHGSGYLREAALTKVHGPLPGAFFVAAIIYRLNDWVPQVRHAARDCLLRTAKLTDPNFVAAAGLQLLVQTESWRRWRDEAEVLDDMLAAPEVVQRLGRAIAASNLGPMAKTLRAALRTPALDSYLPDLLRHARQPSVRALALRTLLDAKARWPWGMEKKWIDKSLGRFRHGADWRERPLERLLPMDELIEMGARDRAASVRKVAASGLIAHFDTMPNARALAERLAQDRSRTVRERAIFALDRAGLEA